MNCNLESINLFKGYTQEENTNTHAFLAFLNYLLHTDKNIFKAFWQSLKIGGNKIDTKDIEINCLKQDFGGTWDGQIFSKTNKWFIAIESKIKKAAVNPIQLKQHKQNIKGSKKQFKVVKLILLTPFDKDWLIKEYYHGKREQNIEYLSWGDVYKSVTGIISNPAQRFVVDQYKLFLEAANGNRSGIIQIVSKEFIDDEYIQGVKAGKINMFHIPSKKIGFDLPNFKVFVYDHEKGGIFSYFTSNGMYLNPEKKFQKSFKHYFEIERFKELKTPITPLDIRKLLGKKHMGGEYEKFKNFKRRKCPAPYYVLNAEMVDALEIEANRR